MQYKRPDLLYYGIDYFKASIEYINKENSFWKSGFNKLGLSLNSNICFYNEDIMIELDPDILTHKYLRVYKIRDTKKNINLAFLFIAKENDFGSVKLNDFIEVSGQGLTIYGFEFWINFFRGFGIIPLKYKRVDLCFDLKIDVDYLYKTIFRDKLENKKVLPYLDKNVCTGFYIGETDKIKNSYQLIRVYDKKLDNQKKGKKWLYPFYTNIKNIARIEVEFRRDKACLFTTEKLSNQDYIFSVIAKTIYNYNFNFFKQIQPENFQEIKKLEFSRNKKRLEMIQTRYNNFVQYGNEFINEKDEKKQVNTFVSYGVKLLKNGYKIDKLMELLRLKDPKL